MKSAIEQALRAAGGEVTISRIPLADKLGVSPQAVHEWLHRGWMPLDRAKQVSDWFGIPLRELVKDDIAAAMDVATASAPTE